MHRQGPFVTDNCQIDSNGSTQVFFICFRMIVFAELPLFIFCLHKNRNFAKKTRPLPIYRVGVSFNSQKNLKECNYCVVYQKQKSKKVFYRFLLRAIVFVFIKPGDISVSGSLTEIFCFHIG